MKKYYIFLLSITLLFLFTAESRSQLPTYNLTAANFKYYGCPANTLEFDILLQHTNSPTPFMYNTGQYFFNFNTAIANGGTLSYQIVGSDLPNNLIPVNPSVSGSQLRLAANLPGGQNGSYHIPDGSTIRIVRMRLVTTATEFAAAPLNLQWRNPSGGGLATKIFAYTTLGVDVTTENTHSISANPPLFTCEKFLLMTPKFNSPTNPSPVTFSWNGSQQAVSYKLQVSTDNNFGSFVVNDSGIVDVTRSVTGLTDNTRYYWRVLAMNSGGSYYSTSQTWYFNTGFPNNGQTPTYTLTAKNFNMTQSNQLEFDIYLYHTNPPATLEFSVGQYFMNFNPLIANGGTLSLSIIDSDLPANLLPRNPTVAGNELRLAANNQPAGPGFGYNMTGNVFPGTKIVKLRLSTTASQFANEMLDLQWINSGNGFFTKIFAYVGTVNSQIFSDITTPSTHLVSSDILLPVELTSFTYSIDRNNVALNWSTGSETNNSGFEIERAVSNNTPVTYSKIGFVQGNGTTNGVKDYSFNDRVSTGKYLYRLKQIDFNGNFEYFNLSEEVNVGIARTFSLSQNYPNPFNPETRIDYEVPDDAMINIALYDISGKEIMTLMNEFKTAGYYTLRLDGSQLSSGIYIYRLKAGSVSLTRKMTLLK